MSRTLSLPFLQSLNAPQTGLVYVMLMTIEHSSLAIPIRLSSDPTVEISVDPYLRGTVSRGNTYEFAPFSTIMPDDKQDAAPRATIIVDGIDQDVVKLLRSTSTPATVTLELVVGSAPDVVEMILPQLDLVSADYDAGSVTISLVIDSLQTEPFPCGTFTPPYFPALF